MEDHVHMAIRMTRTTSIADVIRQVKSRSAHWVKSLPGEWAEFAWQTGYGAFSVSPRDKKHLYDYIESQVEHHRDMSFEQEYLKLIESHRIMYDPRYLWD
jgi:putative transposase